MADEGERQADELRPSAPSAPTPTARSADTTRGFRSELTTGENVVDPLTWAGSIPQVRGIAPRVRIGRSRWFNLL